MNKHHLLAGVVAVVALVGLPIRGAAAAIDPDVARVIRDSSGAIGIPALAKVRVIQMNGELSAIGIHGTGYQWVGVANSTFSEGAVLTPYVQRDGWDGKSAWNSDGTGLVWTVGGDSGRSAEINAAYLATYDLWKANARGALVTYLGQKSEKGVEYDALRILPKGSLVPVDVWFDRTSHLPLRTIQVNGTVTATTTLSNYKRVNGVMIPFAIHVDSTDGNNSDATIARVAFDPKGGAAHLERPTTTPHDFSMQNGATSTTVPIDLVENHVYLNVMLNGKGPYRFIFDTGGQNIIDPAVAKEIGAFGMGSAQGAGVGSRTEELSFAMVKRLQVGAAQLSDQLFAVAPVREGFGVSAGQPADGLIGWEVLARYVTSFNYAEKTVVLTMPGAAKPDARARAVPFVLNGTQPQIPCEIDGIASECTIDTGARDTLSFYSPYLARHPNVTPATLSAVGVNGFGFGGAELGKLGRVDRVELGGFTLRHLIADYSTQTAGAMASPFTAANIGGNLLRRFDVTFDYSKQTMSLVPNADYSSPESFDRGGMFIIRKGDKLVVIDARPGTPAADAGIVKGDAIASVDGMPTTGMSLQTLRGYFFEAPGTVLKLVLVNAGGAQRDVTLTLRDYI